MEAPVKGARPLLDTEVEAVLSALNSGPFKLRNRALFILGLRSGFRISELLSLDWSQVVQNDTIVTHVTVAKRYMKKKVEGRTVALHEEAKSALKDWFLISKPKSLDCPVFLSRQKNRMNRISAWCVLKKAYDRCNLTGMIGCHGMRKTFAKKVHAKLGHDLLKTQKALGHRSVNSTVSYLSVDNDEIDEAVRKS